jgi:RHS repeat-associated protein
LTKTLGGVTETYAYDSGDKLTAITGGSNPRTFGYDASGRTTSVVTGAGTTTLSYAYESRITSISGPLFTGSYSYNGLDTRVSKTENSVDKTFLRDGDYVTDPVLSDSSATFTPGISERRGSTTTFSHSGLKNASFQSGTSQSVSAERTYDAFGLVTNSIGNWQGPFGYAGGFGYQEDASGLKLLGHRYYDSSTGRFLTRDPIKDGRNWYAYCQSAPVHNTDPTGYWLIVLGAVALVGYGLYELYELGEDVRERSEKGRANRQSMDDAFGSGDEEAYQEGMSRIQVQIKQTGALLADEFYGQYILGVIVDIPSRSVKPEIAYEMGPNPNTGSWSRYFDKHHSKRKVYDLD